MGEDILCLCDLFLRSGESDLHFPGSARDLNFDGVETIADHTGAELFVGFVGAVFLEAIAKGKESPVAFDEIYHSMFCTFKVEESIAMGGKQILI